MSEKTSYADGVPCWTDVTSTDIAATKAFYEGLFGWKLDDMGTESGNYVMCSLRSKPVAALSPRMDGDPAPPHWNTYLKCDDVDATVAKVRAAGGMVAIEPMDVFEAGRMAFAADPTGAFFGLWQPRAHIGAMIVNEPGGYQWAELRTRDVDAALAFYTAVFGFDVASTDMGDMVYHGLRVKGEDESMAGVMPMPDQMFPPDVPAHWAVYFGIADIDAGSARVKELGGNQLMEPVTLEFGRFAAYTDSNGAAFSLFQTT
jgi:predicted enzyme related to lactoylglutathione lyase